MNLLFDGLSLFVHVRIAWDGLHVEINLMLILVLLLSYYWIRLASCIVADYQGWYDFEKDDKKDWKPPDPGVNGIHRKKD